MAEIIMHAAEFADAHSAQKAELELRQFIDEMIEYESTATDPWDGALQPPVKALGERCGVEWKSREVHEVLIRGLFRDEAKLIRQNLALFFWAPGFGLGGPYLDAVLQNLGAHFVTHEPRLLVRCGAPLEVHESLLEDLSAGGYPPPESSPEASFSIHFASDEKSRTLSFADKSAAAWAFVAVLPQLCARHPSAISLRH